MENNNWIWDLWNLRCLRDLVNILINGSEVLDKIQSWNRDFRAVCIMHWKYGSGWDSPDWMCREEKSSGTESENSDIWWMSKGGVAHRRNWERGREIGNKESVMSWYQRKTVFQMEEDVNSVKCCREYDDWK